MVMAPFVSPSALVRRDLLAQASAEAVRYGSTVREVVDAFFAGRPRPELVAGLDRAFSAAGIPPHELMGMVAEFFDADRIETADLLTVLEAHGGRLPTPAQARELVEGAQRLARRARLAEKQIKAAQAAHDATVVERQDEPPPLPSSPPGRAVRARAVQRYSGLRATRR